jgi:hypothetical protein
VLFNQISYRATILLIDHDHTRGYKIRYFQTACVVCHDGKYSDGRRRVGDAKTGQIMNMELS